MYAELKDIRATIQTPTLSAMEQLLEENRQAREAEAAERALREKLSQLTEDQLKIISAIDPGSTHIDDITDRTGLSTSRVLAQLTVLEIKGIVRREAGRRFALNITVEK